MKEPKEIHIATIPIMEVKKQPILSEWQDREKALEQSIDFYKKETANAQGEQARLVIEIEKLEQALYKINEMSDCGSYELSIIRMKSIANYALKTNDHEEKINNNNLCGQRDQSPQG